MNNQIRQPKQGRSIETKNKIIDAGYKLFSEVGYYGTNTAEIAKFAGVSTGIVYGYFKDKRDILISVLAIYIEKVFEPLLKKLDGVKAPLNLEGFVAGILDEVIKTHKKNRKMHEALHSLAGNDELVSSEFIRLEDDITVKIAEKLPSLGIVLDSPLEKVHFAMDIIQSFSHEFVFDKHDYIDYSKMRDMVIKTIIDLFN